MNSPEPPPPPLEPEVLPPELPARRWPAVSRAPTASAVPFHPWSAVLLLVADNLWTLAEFAVVSWLLTVPLSFLVVFTGTFLIQRRQGGDSVGRALAKALLLGAIAAVPFSVTGTPVGLALLAWAGIRHPWKKG